MTLKDALYALFTHYASKPTAANSFDPLTLDALGFSKFCKDAPNLDFLNRYEMKML